MHPSHHLLVRLPIRRATSRQSWTSFVESVTSHNPSSSTPTMTAATIPSPTPYLREEPVVTSSTTTNKTSTPSYRRFKPTSRFSIYKMTEIQRTVDESADYKLIFYAPVDSVNRIKEAIFEVGGGVLGGGKYTRCCFSSYGTGQFKAEVGALGGEVGVMTVREEVRVEVLCHGKKVTKAAVRALLHTHPLDVPAYEVYKTEFGFLPHQLIAQPKPEERLSWRPRTQEEEKMASEVSDKISKQFEGARLAARRQAVDSSSPSGTTSSSSSSSSISPQTVRANDGDDQKGGLSKGSKNEDLTAILDFLEKNTDKESKDGNTTTISSSSS
ncbi:hypothetical protein TWF703_008852 [Orbilia oligospora]|uniref:ATP phosphoribosyltransferase n=1 Tax=Orbilia oligospora TaxID=2813651 RepID=A0A7C8NLR9_ORBOL|nr:hypothetical protein TWF703_008852 [Orbilia oligospora]